jgi:4-amino-4-deoxy-L-arabinose transferase-like glycosyltransferase
VNEEGQRQRYGFVLAVIAYFGILFLLRGVVFSGAAMDEADELLFAQSFQRGYMFRNPPLFTWLLLLFESITPPSDSLPVLIRYLALATGYICLYRASLRLFRQRDVALVAALTPVALYLVGWRMITTYTHSALLFAACAATLLALLRLREDASLLRYVIFGIVLGVGLAAKYNFALFAGTLIVAACMDAQFRRLFSTPRFALSIVIALLLFAPHAGWLIEHRAESSYVAQHRLGTAESWSDFGKRFYALYALGRSLLEFVVPLLLLIPFALRKREITAEEGDERRLARWLERSLVLQLAILATSVFVAGAVQIRVHHVLTLMLFPIALLLHFRDRVNVRRARAMLLTVALLILPLAGVDLWRSAQRDSDRLRQVDYGALAATLRREQLDRGTAVVLERGYAISGSLRPYLPDAQIRSSKWPEFASARIPRQSTYVFLWRKGELDRGFAQPLQNFVERHPSLVISSIDVPTHGGNTVAFGYLALRPMNAVEHAEDQALADEVLRQTSVERGWRNG